MAFLCGAVIAVIFSSAKGGRELFGPIGDNDEDYAWISDRTAVILRVREDNRHADLIRVEEDGRQSSVTRGLDTSGPGLGARVLTASSIAGWRYDRTVHGR